MKNARPLSPKEPFKTGRVLISSSRIKARVQEIARSINRAYSGKELLIIVLLKGSFVFAADLIRAVRVDSSVDFVKVHSYGNSMKPKKLAWSLRPSDDVKGRNILLIDDIYDSGRTLYNVSRYLKRLKPASIRLCVLLKKKRPHAGKARLDYAGFVVPDVFVVGYGLDYAGKFRNLPYIAEITGK
jgi:hypoxanthine phosphoribosyltransferase